jgi:hypothetical protein
MSHEISEIALGYDSVKDPLASQHIVIKIRVLCKQDYEDFGHDFLQLPRRLYSVQYWHRQIEDDQSGAMLHCQFNSVLPISGLSAVRWRLLF